MRTQHKHLYRLLSASTLATLIAMPTQAEDLKNKATAMELQDVEVIGTTPLPGIGLDVDKYAGQVQSISAKDMEEQNAIDIAESLFRNLGSVDINAAQNNPFQNDVHYRGFLASPLLGSAIGISTYIDGVRINEGFGDTVNWDLIPQFAISNISLIPGSNPLFGLNTLGGSLAMQTKNGVNFEGTSLTLSGGSWGRRSATIEHGGNAGNFDWYLGAKHFEEDGWRQKSPSDVTQVFTKVGWEDEDTDIDLSYTFADNDLIGNGFVPTSHVDADRDSVYTFPDQTENKMHFLNLRGSHWLSDNVLVAGNLFHRNFKRKTLNGDAEVECVNDGNEVPLFLADNAGEDPTLPGTELRRVHNANCDTDTINNAVIGSRTRAPFNPLGGDEAELEVEGEDRNTITDTDNWGASVQFTFDEAINGHDNQFIIGGAYDKSDTKFVVSEAEADLMQFGLARGTANAEAQEVDVDIKTQKENIALYATDTYSITDRLAWTLSGRYQYTNVKIKDRTGLAENQDLNGDHTFNRLNPATGFSYKASDNLVVYTSYNESFRAPTAAELTCADPDDPCNLPNSFVADPPLDPVIGKTFEVGARGLLYTTGQKLRWNASIFRTTLKDDLLFTTISSAGAGFFQNVDKTRRQGVELGLNGATNRLAWFANYSFIDATFESSERLASVVDPEGLYVKSGDQVPAIPQHNVKVGVNYAATDKFFIGGNMTYASGSYMRGDENNQLGKTSSYTVFNMNARYIATDNIQLWLKVDNLFDKEYVTAGIRNFNAFPVNGGDIEEERFIAPGAPRAAWAGMKITY